MVDNKPSAQLSLPGIALVVIALGVFAISDTAFVPTRPDVSSELTSTAEDVRARLWQDPFEAIETHRGSKHTSKKTKDKVEVDEKFQRLESRISNYSMYQDQQHRVCDVNPKATARKIAELARIKLKIKALEENAGAVTEITKKKKEKKKIEAGFVRTSAHTIGELRCQIQRKYEENVVEHNSAIPDKQKDFYSHSKKSLDLHIVAVMVPGGPYAEDRETRIRSRYAVISALSSAGYYPSDAEHIGYMDFASLCNWSLKGYLPDSRYCDWPATIPYEWFKSTGDAHKNDAAEKAEEILVLWLDDAEISFAQPLEMLHRLNFGLTPGKYEGVANSKNNMTIKFDVLGPASSTTLVTMYKEAEEICFETELVNCQSKGDSSTKNTKSNALAKSAIRIFSYRSTIDNYAINKTIAAGKDKGDDPAQWLFIRNKSSADQDDSWFNLQRTISTDKVLVDGLLCELLRRGVNPYYHNTDFSGYSDCANFMQSGLNENTLLSDKKPQDYVVLIGESDTLYSRNFHDLFHDKIKEKSGDREPVWLWHYNYFRGIDGSIETSDSGASKKDNESSEKTSLRRPVGENQYDYLRRLGQKLIERANEITGKGSIRAIGIVGSDTYDKLLVLQALRNKFPDVVFFTTDLDARMLHAEENKWARNLVVASGYGLSPELESACKPKPKRRDSVIPFRDSYQTSLYTAALAATDTTENKLLNPGVSKIFEIGNKYAIEYTTTKKYHSNNRFILYSGLLFLLLVLLMYQTSNKTRFYLLISAATIILVISWVALFDTEHSTEYYEMLSGTSIWPSLIIRMFAAVLSLFLILFALSVLKDNTNDIKKEYGLDVNSDSPGVFDRIFISAWGCRYVEEAGGEKYRIDIHGLMSQYFTLGSTLWWSIRVALMLTLYIFITVVFLSSFPDLPYAPSSDKSSATAQEYVKHISGFLYLFLVFFVVDVTKLNARFVILVSKCKVEWPRILLEKYNRTYGVNEEVAEEKLKLDLIVLRSKAVDMLIFLPFIVLTLMIVSRSTYFDRWYMSVQLALVVLLGACIALSSAIRLRRSAKMVRAHALDNLEAIYKKLIYAECKRDVKKETQTDEDKTFKKKALSESEICNAKMSVRVSRIIDDVKSLNEGPFAPIAQHPIVSAIAMPFGGVGGLYLIDYFANVGV